MIDQKINFWLFVESFKAICWPKENNCGKCLILLMTVLFLGEECLSLHTLLKADLSRQFCLEKLLQICKNTFQ